jgi:hypothetical protein
MLSKEHNSFSIIFYISDKINKSAVFINDADNVIHPILTRKNYFARKIAISGGRKIKNGILVCGYDEIIFSYGNSLGKLHKLISEYRPVNNIHNKSIYQRLPLRV